MRLKLNREMWRLIPQTIRNRIVNGIKSPYPKTVYEAFPCYQDLMSLACKDGKLQDDLRQWVVENNSEIMRVFAESSAKARAKMVQLDPQQSVTGESKA